MRGVAAVRQADSPRIYQQGPAASESWPSDTGLAYVQYSICGVQPLRWPAADPCQAPMTLITSVTAAGPDLDVLFQTTWLEDRKQHRWSYRISPDGSAIVLAVGGDPLPVLPQ